MSVAQFDAETLKMQATQASQLLKAMSNETRLMILCRLCAGETAAGELQADFDMTQSAISQHLGILREHQLVSSRRESQVIFYRISDPAAAKVIETLISIYCPT